MQELLFIQEYFFSLLASDIAKNLFKDRVYFSTSDALQYDLNISQETLDYCQNYMSFNFLDTPDIRESIRFSEKDYILETKDIYFTYQSLKQWHELTQLEILPTIYPILNLFIHEIHFSKQLLSHWNKAFDSEGNISDSASPELKRIRSMKKVLRKQIEKILGSKLQQNEDLAEKRIAFREDRYVLPVKSVAKNRTEGIVHGFSSTGLITYIEPPEVISLNNELLSVDDLEHREINRLLRQWSKIISENIFEIILIMERSAELEILFAKYHFITKYNATLGSINTNKEITLIKVYNPFLLIKKGRNQVVPISIELEQEKNGIIISGPNAGGKSAALKTLAICTDMFLKGLPIPAEVVSLPLFSDLLIEIGDSQNLDDDLSTFSGHLYSIKKILKNCNPNTLVLIDEIAHATDPIEGEALACAIIDELIKKGTFFAITTHYKQVKIKSFEHQFIKTYATGFDIKNLCPQFILYPNTIGESYALNIATRIGLNPKIVQSAIEILDQNKNNTEVIISNIEDFERKLRQKEQQLVEQENKFDIERRNLQSQKDQLLSQTTKLKEQGLVQADKELSYCLRELSAIQKDIAKNPQQNSKKLKEVQKIINQKKEEVTNLSRPKKTLLIVGERVFVASLNKDAIVEEILENLIVIRAGIIKMSVKKSDIFESSSKNNTKQIYQTKKQYTDDIAHQVDVHGFTVDEALPEIEKYLYSAMVSGMPEFIILHGKGTGVLQKAIHKYLKTIPEIKKYHFATAKDGGSGKTIVYFIN